MSFIKCIFVSAVLLLPVVSFADGTGEEAGEAVTMRPRIFCPYVISMTEIIMEGRQKGVAKAVYLEDFNADSKDPSQAYLDALAIKITHRVYRQPIAKSDSDKRAAVIKYRDSILKACRAHPGTVSREEEDPNDWVKLRGSTL